MPTRGSSRDRRSGVPIVSIQSCPRAIKLFLKYSHITGRWYANIVVPGLCRPFSFRATPRRRISLIDPVRVCQGHTVVAGTRPRIPGLARGGMSAYHRYNDWQEGRAQGVQPTIPCNSCCRSGRSPFRDIKPNYSRVQGPARDSAARKGAFRGYAGGAMIFQVRRTSAASDSPLLVNSRSLLDVALFPREILWLFRIRSLEGWM